MLSAGLKSASRFMSTNGGAALKAGLVGAGSGFGLGMATGQGFGQSMRMAAFGGAGSAIGGIGGHIYGSRGISGSTIDMSAPFSRMPAYVGATGGGLAGMGFARLTSNRPVNGKRKRR